MIARRTAGAKTKLMCPGGFFMKKLIALFIVMLCARSVSATEIRTKALTVAFPETWKPKSAPTTA